MQNGPQTAPKRNETSKLSDLTSRTPDLSPDSDAHPPALRQHTCCRIDGGGGRGGGARPKDPRRAWRVTDTPSHNPPGDAAACIAAARGDGGGLTPTCAAAAHATASPGGGGGARRIRDRRQQVLPTDRVPQGMPRGCPRPLPGIESSPHGMHHLTWCVPCAMIRCRDLGIMKG
jgi:hypothetical protein